MLHCLLFSNAGSGSNVMNATIEHVKVVGGTEVIVNQYIPSYNDGQNQLQASPVVTAVVKMQAGDTVRVMAGSDQHFRLYSIGLNTHVSFSGHNCD